MSSKIMSGEDLAINETEIREQSQLLGILHNTYKYFVTYANLHQFEPGRAVVETTPLDNWIILRSEALLSDYSHGLDQYDFVQATRAIRPFIEDLSTWYIRRSRERFVAGDQAALATLYTVLLKFAITVAPTLPFTADHLYRGLTLGAAQPSVHLENYPIADQAALTDGQDLLQGMSVARQVCSVLNMLRAEAKIPSRQPLQAAALVGFDHELLLPELMEIIRQEANVKEVKLGVQYSLQASTDETGTKVISLDPKITPELAQEGRFRELIRNLQEARKKAGLQVGQQAVLHYYTTEAELQTVIERFKLDILQQVSLSDVIGQANQGDLEAVAKESLFIRFV